MNERHPSGYTPDYDAYGYDAYSTGAYQTVGTTFADADPLFGPSPDATGSYAFVPQSAQYAQHGYGYDPGYGYDQGQGQQQYQAQSPVQNGGYDTGAHAVYDPYAAQAATTYYDTGTYDTSAFYQGQGQQTGTGYQAEQPGYQAEYQTAYQQPQHTATMPTIPQQQDWDSGAYPAYGYGYGYEYGYGYDAGGDTGVYEQVTLEPQPQPQPVPEQAAEPEPVAAGADVTDFAYEAPYDDEPAVRHDYADAYPADELPVARSRRRKPAKRSALLTVAVPSVAVMGVAAVGAAAIGGVGMGGSSKAQANSQDGTGSSATNAPTTQFDRQLAGVSADADDFATRASRTQERIDLKDRQAAAKRAKADAAARKEALRPKFLLPVKQRGLSAYFGQAGVNWMALHTGIDFPVQPGTPVSAVTDGTVRTQWNSSYGNMAIVTAPDGTETWYCHLSSTKIRSGSVKAGTVIAYSGNTGNTTGPHLHLEVRPHGGSPIDPLPWLLAHGLDPR